MTTIQKVFSSFSEAAKNGSDIVKDVTKKYAENPEYLFSKYGEIAKSGRDIVKAASKKFDSPSFMENVEDIINIVNDEELNFSEKASQVLEISNKGTPLCNVVEFGFDLGEKAVDWFKGLFSQTE